MSYSVYTISTRSRTSSWPREVLMCNARYRRGKKEGCRVITRGNVFAREPTNHVPVIYLSTRGGQAPWLFGRLADGDRISDMRSKELKNHNFSNNRSAYAQCAIKFVLCMLSMDCTCSNRSHFTAGWACEEIRSLYAQCAMKSVPRMLSMR